MGEEKKGVVDLEELRKLTPQTAYALHSEYEASKQQRADFEERMNVLAKEIKAEARAGYFEMLKEVKTSVADLGQVITLQFDKFRLEMKNVSDNHEGRIVELEQQEQTTNARLASLEGKTKDIEELRSRLSKLNDTIVQADLAKSIPDIQESIAIIKNASGENAKSTISAFKVAVIGAFGAAVIAGLFELGKLILKALKLIS